MTAPRFFQIDFVKDTAASLINRNRGRDESGNGNGLSDRTPYISEVGIRFSSQSRKYWL